MQVRHSLIHQDVNTVVISRPELTRARNHIGVETAHKTKEKLCYGLCSASLPSEYHLQVNKKKIFYRVQAQT